MYFHVSNVFTNNVTVLTNASASIRTAFHNQALPCFPQVLLTIILKGFEYVKNDVTKQPNDYEMVDFVMRRFKKFIGVNSVTPLKDIVAEHQQEQEESENVRQLPDKVSTFIDQINHTFFDGKLDLNDKKLLKKTLRQAKHEHRGRPKSMDDFQRDE